jgi:enoyl-CoA hydratase/carnithine racemase
MKSFETIEIEQSGEIVTLYLNQPKFNMFSIQMMTDLIDYFHYLRNKPEIRFLIITTKGDHMTVGVDLNELAGPLASDNPRAAENCRMHQLNGQELLRSLESLEQITVAALRGAVVGAGMTMATSCDFRIMCEKSFFSIPETNIGFYYTWGSTPRLVEMLGVSKAMEIIMHCVPIYGPEAYDLGLVNRVVPDEPRNELMKTTHEFIEKIAIRGTTAIRITKKIAIGAAMRGIGNMFIPETEMVEGMIGSGEPSEGIQAFLEKRTPKFGRK